MEEEMTRENEISLIDLLAVLLKAKWLIIITTVGCALAAVAVSIVSLILPPEKSNMPNVYTPKALMLINNSSSSSSSLSSMLSSSGLGSLASMAGVSAGGSSYSALAEYLIKTNSFLDSIIAKFDMVSRLKIKSKAWRSDSRKKVSTNLVAKYDGDSGVFSISYSDIDPVFAQSIVNYCVDYYEQRFAELGLDKNRIQKENLEKNIKASYAEIEKLEGMSRQLERSVSMGASASSIPSIVMDSTKLKREIDAQEQIYTQLKVQYELLKVQMASDTPVFQVLERAEVPDQKSGPSRGKLCIIVTFAGLFGSIFFVFIREAIKGIKNDPIAMAKLKGLK